MHAFRFDTEQAYRRFLTAYQTREKPTQRHQGGPIYAGGGSQPVDGAQRLLQAILAAGLPGPWYREFTFHESRGWRLDVACPQRKCGLECDGGVHRIKGRFMGDIEKHNALVMGGWRYLRCTPAQVDNGEAIRLLTALLQETIR